MKKKILFLVNPIAGGINKKNFPALVKTYLDHRKYADEIRYWTDDKNAVEMTQAAIQEGFDIIVAVGGDGTINQVGSTLKHSHVAMGIVPMGSGNGLARHLGIPLSAKTAIQFLNQKGIQKIDTVNLDDRTYVNVAGAGFDAHIGKLFATAHTRGFSTYAKITLRELASYQPQEYTLSFDGKTITENAFLISFANGSQWGNNATIAPQASLFDGKVDIAIMKKFNWWQIPAVGLQMFTRNIHHSAVMQHYAASEILVTRAASGAVHMDGEPGMAGSSFKISVNPASLQVIA